jgi:hypothetical protein
VIALAPRGLAFSRTSSFAARAMELGQTVAASIVKYDGFLDNQVAVSWFTYLSRCSVSPLYVELAI